MLGNKVVLTLDAFVMSSKITFQETKNVLKGKNIFFFPKSTSSFHFGCGQAHVDLYMHHPKNLRYMLSQKKIPNNVSQTSEGGV